MGGGKSGLNGGGGGGRGKNGGSLGKAVQAMVGKEALMEFDNGDHPNKYPENDPKWGMEPGTYTVYRAGNIGRESVVFTANSYKGSEDYARAFPDSEYEDIDPQRAAVYTYTVTIKNPYVSKNLRTTYEELFGKPPRTMPTPSEIKKGITTGDLWNKADDRIAKKLKSKGYDSWMMYNPAPPAKRELNLLGPAVKTMKATARKIPDHVKREWKSEAEKNGYFAHAYKNGKHTGLTVNEWFKMKKT